MWDIHYKDVRSQNPLVWPDVQIARLLAKTDLLDDAKVLDLGCGEGRNIRLLLDNNYDVMGIDQSINALKIVEKLYGIERDNLICNDAIKALNSLPDSNFDLVLSWGLMHYIENTEELLNEIYRSLKIDSYTILSFSSNKEKRETVDTVKRYFSQNEVEEILEKSCFKIIDLGLIENQFLKEQKSEAFFWVLAKKE